MKKIFLVLLVFMMGFLFMDLTYSRSGISGRSANIPMPIILMPRSEVAIAGEDGRIKFKWKIPGAGGFGLRGYVDFRIYKGFEPYGDARIFKEKFQTRQREVSLDQNMFEKGQAYVMTLSLVESGTKKSKKSSHSFTVR